MAPVSNKEFILFSAHHAIVKLQIHLLNLTTFKDSFSRSFQYFYKISDKIPIVKQWRWGLRSGRSQSSVQLWAERTSHPHTPHTADLTSSHWCQHHNPPPPSSSSSYSTFVSLQRVGLLFKRYFLNNQLSWFIILSLFLILNQKCVFWIKYVKIRAGWWMVVGMK